MSELPPDAEAQRAETIGESDEPPTAAESDDYETDSSGVPAADEAAARLRDLDDAPVDEHVEIYEDAHRRLEAGLADLDER
jgi:hypothetical protein